MLTSTVSEHDFIKVFASCDIEILRNREIIRGNRCIGSAEASLQYLYPKDGYDIVIDSGTLNPVEAAESIEKYINSL